MNPSPSSAEYGGRSPEGNDGRGSMPACAGMDGQSAHRVSRWAWADLGAARRSAHASVLGFTLIEMIVVVAIVGILATAAVPLTEMGLRRAKELQLRQALRTLREAIDAYKRAADAGQIKLPSDASGYPATLDLLVSGVEMAPPPVAAGASAPATTATSSTTGKRIYFLRSLPRDPMADSALPAARTWALRSYDSPPEAPRPGRDVFDVHSQSMRRAIDGSLYRDW